MSHRLEIELTSERPDGTWTWRAAGAKQPKGDLDQSLLPAGARVGDVVKAEADFSVDGIDILSITTNKRVRKEPELLSIVGSGKEEPLITTTYVERKGRDRDRDRGRRRDRDHGRDGDGRGRDRNRDGRDGDGRGRDRGRDGRGDGNDRSRRRDRGEGGGDRWQRRERAPERARAPRLHAGKAHRSAVLSALPEEHQPIAEQVLRGGIPAVREAIAKQNAQAKKENRPEIHADQLVDLAEKLMPQLRAAEWRDRADAALAGIDEIDLRDLRSVIVAADSAGRDPEALSIRDQIQEGLSRRVELEHAQWLAEMKSELDAGRFIRVLRLTSRPPKAGTPIPVDISSRLITVVTNELKPGLSQDLWARTLDALAFSPVRSSVVVTERPEEPSAELLEAVKRVGSRLPEVARLFGFDPEKLAAEGRKSAPRRQSKSKSKDRKGKDGEAKGEAAKVEAAKGEAPEPTEDTPTVDAENGGAKAEAATDAKVSDADTNDAEVVEVSEAPEVVEASTAPEVEAEADVASATDADVASVAEAGEPSE